MKLDIIKETLALEEHLNSTDGYQIQIWQWQNYVTYINYLLYYRHDYTMRYKNDVCNYCKLWYFLQSYFNIRISTT